MEGVSWVLQMAVPSGMEEVKLLWGFRDDLRQLQTDFEMFKAVLSSHDGEGSSLSARDRPAVRAWLNNANDIAYGAQDLLDELAYEDVRRQTELKQRIGSKFRSLFNGSNPIIFRHRMAHRVARLKARIAQAYQSAKTLQDSLHLLQPRQNINSNSYNNNIDNLQQARDLASAYHMVGRQADVSKLLQELRRSTHTHHHTGKDPLSVLAIVGFPGLGKTTLARKVYDDPAIDHNFPYKHWVTVSRVFDIKKILAEVKAIFVPSNEDGINKQLGQQLRGQRYLLVLDDVWNQEKNLWDALRDSLLGIGEGTFLVTTRDEGVVEAISASYTHHLAGLSEKDSWLLFKQIVFDGRSEEEILKFHKVGEKIVDKCQGVPLAIRTVAGLLHSEKEIRAWKEIEKNRLWNLPQGDTGILPSLKLSYNYLPHPLKRCFAFLAFIDKGYVFHKDEVIQIWCAHGYLGQQCDGNSSSMEEDAGEKYFNILLNISFLSVYEKDELGNATWYNMHDLVHDLSLYVNDEFMTWDDPTKCQQSAPAVFRHLYVKKPVIKTSEFSEPLHLKRLRSLCLESISEQSTNLLRRTKYLRMLDLSGSNLREMPGAVGALKCLKYLDVSYTEIEALPESITRRLYNLQTLRLENCHKLSELPIGLGNLVNLRHICTTKHVKVPPGIRRLTSLRTAPLIELKAENDGSLQMHELGCLHNLSGRLSMKGLEHVQSSQEAKAAEIFKKERIDSLELIWSASVEEGNNNNYGVLDALQPHEFLKSLKVLGFVGEEFPRWLQSMTIFGAEMNDHERLEHLQKLELIECKRCQEIPQLGRLRSLQILLLQGMERVSRIGLGFYDCGDGDYDGPTIGEYFPALKELIIEDLPSLEEWLPPADGCAISFPRLEILRIKCCPKLVSVPEANFTRLRELAVNDVCGGQPLLRLINNCSHSSTTGPVSLTSLTIEGVRGLHYLPGELLVCTPLRELTISQCWDLSELRVGNLQSLEVLGIYGCSDELVKLPDMSRLVSLRVLVINCCKGLTRPPSDLGSCTSLRELTISWCENLSIPNDMLSQLCNHIEHLVIVGLRDMTRSFQVIPKFKRLSYVEVGGFGEEYEYFPGIQHLSNIPSLQQLVLHGWGRLRSVPEQLQHLTTLTYLHLNDFNSIETIPEWLGKLTSLVSLDIRYCNCLKTLPDALKYMKNLVLLNVSHCQLLREGCRKDNGPEWPKISKIPVIKVDDQDIQRIAIS